MMPPRFWLRRSAAPPPISADKTEKLLCAAALWEPDALPPVDFAAFTRHALARAEKSPYRGAANYVRWVGALRSPLAVGLASACVLWVGGNQIAPYEAADAIAPAKQVKQIKQVTNAQAEATPGQKQTGAQGQWVQMVRTAVKAAVANEPLYPSRFASRRVRHKSRWVQTAPVVEPPPVAKAALWKTETVERPAWGALVPVPFAAECNAASVVASGEKMSAPTEGEASSAIMPVVLDVALPDVETEMPVSAPSPLSTP